MTDKQIQHTIEMYHRKAMRELAKRLRFNLTDPADGTQK
jgi:hypothetical protein